MEVNGEKKVKGIVQKDELIAQSKELGVAVAEDFALGTNVRFGYDEDQGLFLDFNNKRKRLSPAIHKQIVREIGMPLKYFNSTPVELTVPHLNYYYRNVMKDKKARLLCDGDSAFGLSLNPRDEFVPLSQIINTIEDVIGEDNIEGYHNPRFGWDLSNINVVQKKTFSVLKDDLLNVGIRFEHSMNTLNPDHACAYTFRQFCSNGAVTMDKLGSWKRAETAGSYRKWVESTVFSAQKAIIKEEKRLRQLTEIKTDKSTGDILDHILTESYVAKDVRKEILSMAIDEPTETMYDIYNILTKIATHSTIFEKHPAAITLVENVAKQLAGHTKLCPVCHHATN